VSAAEKIIASSGTGKPVEPMALCYTNTFPGKTFGYGILMSTVHHGIASIWKLSLDGEFLIFHKLSPQRYDIPFSLRIFVWRFVTLARCKRVTGCK